MTAKHNPTIVQQLSESNCMDEREFFCVVFQDGKMIQIAQTTGDHITSGILGILDELPEDLTRAILAYGIQQVRRREAT